MKRGRAIPDDTEERDCGPDNKKKSRLPSSIPGDTSEKGTAEEEPTKATKPSTTRTGRPRGRGRGARGSRSSPGSMTATDGESVMNQILLGMNQIQTQITNQETRILNELSSFKTEQQNLATAVSRVTERVEVWLRPKGGR